ncbi:MAG: S8 family serine peptidase [Chloroflexota bacterium]
MRRRICLLVIAAVLGLPVGSVAAAQPSPDPAPVVPSEPPPTADPTPTPSAPAATPVVDETPASASSTPDAKPARPHDDEHGVPDVSGQYIVVLKSGADTNAVVDRHARRDGLKATARFSRAFRGFSAKLDRAQHASLTADPSVAFVVPDEIVKLAAQTTPTGISRMGARRNSIAAINGIDTRVDADVAIVDTGIALHPDLNVAGGYNCTTATRSAWADGNGHGTHVAGTVGALDNGFGVVGVAPGVRLWAVRILNSDGMGKLSWYVCGLDWILAQHDPNDPTRPLIESVNMSVAKDGSDDHNCGRTNNDILHQAICRLVAGGVTVAAAAANDRTNAAHRIPAAYSEVITVSALADTDGLPGGLGGNRCYSWGGYDRDDTFADFSDYGFVVDIIAPGKCIWSTMPGNRYAYMSGTSMATPHVAGAIALYKASRPKATPAEVKLALQYLGNLNWSTSTDPDRYHEKLLDVTRLGRLGTFKLSAGAQAPLGEDGGTLTVPVSLTRSSTFFERVQLSVADVPSGWTAKLAKSYLFGWTGNGVDLAVMVPPSTHAGEYDIRVIGTNQGRTVETLVPVVVENDLPTAQPPQVRVQPFQRLGDRVAVTVSWPVATDPSSAIAGYQLQGQRNGRTWAPLLSGGPSTRSIGQSLARDDVYGYQVRARDIVANWSPWAPMPAPVRVRILNDRNSALKYGGWWSSTSSSSAYAGTLRTSTRTGSTMGLAFSGVGLSIVAPRTRSSGSADVYIDGVFVQRVSFYASEAQSRRIVFNRVLATNGPHMLKLRVVGSKAVDIDAIVLLQQP